MHDELWVTKILNEYLAGPANAVLSLLGIKPEHADHPWADYAAVEVLVLLILMIVPLLVRASLSVDKPGILQQVFEVVYEFLSGMAHDVVGHDSQRYVPFFGTLFLFILTANLIGLIPGLESPTMFAAVPLGCALLVFVYYHFQGMRVHGPLGHVANFTGWSHLPGLLKVLIILLGLIEIISHCIRPVSLTIRLFANMVAGEQVTEGFLKIVPWVVPVIFMGLHVFVAFLQAFIFTVLTMVYVGGAVAHTHSEEHH